MDSIGGKVSKVMAFDVEALEENAELDVFILLAGVFFCSLALCSLFYAMTFINRKKKYIKYPLN
jgi:hypothetical protein